MDMNSLTNTLLKKKKEIKKVPIADQFEHGETDIFEPCLELSPRINNRKLAMILNVSMDTAYNISDAIVVNSGTDTGNGTVDDDDDFTCGVTGNPYYVGGSIICIIGLLLNASFVFVFCRVKCMRTLTNGYLVNLAVSDMSLLFTVVLYFAIALYDPEYRPHPFQCTITFLHTVLLFVSLWMVTIVSIERYLGICNPLKARLFNTRGRVAALVAASWLLGMVCAVPKVVYCSIKPTHPVLAKRADLAVCVVYMLVFLSSMITVATMYSLTVKNFKHSVKKLRKDRINTRKSDERQVLVTCMAISVVFFICTLPAFYKYVMQVIYMATHVVPGGNFSICIYALNRWLLLINSSVNPLIYTITSARCRRAFVQAFTFRPLRHKYTSARRSSTTCNSNTLTTNVIIDPEDMKRRELILKNLSI
ncbi:somatostatin receptor type 5-like [Glandiceps talaboti]